jgi:hypothetical protein
MSNLRDLILAAAVMAAVAIIAVPPWTGHGYAPLWNPPGQEATVDFSRLLLAGVATAFATSVLVFLVGRTVARRQVLQLDDNWLADPRIHLPRERSIWSEIGLQPVSPVSQRGPIPPRPR